MKYWCDFLDSDEAPTKDTTSPRKSGVAYLTENLIKRLTKEENVTQITSLHVTLGKELNKKIKVGSDTTCQSAHVCPILTTCSSCKIYDSSATSCVNGWSGEFDMFERNKVNRQVHYLAASHKTSVERRSRQMVPLVRVIQLEIWCSISLETLKHDTVYG